jgi:hypothetical protein
VEIKRMFEGLTVIAVGLILLANTLGWLAWGVWWNVLSLWPLLLVAAGIDIIGRSTDNTWLRVLGSLVVLGGLAWGALAMPAGSPATGWWNPIVRGTQPSPGTPFSLAEMHDEAIAKGTVTIETGATNLSVGPGLDLFAASGVSPFGKPVVDVSKSGDSADISFRNSNDDSVAGIGGDMRTDIRLDDTVAWDVQTKAGAVSAKMDFEQLDIRSLGLNLGAADAQVTLGERSPATSVLVEAGASSVVIKVPRSAGVVVNSKSGLASVDVGDASQWDMTGQIGDRTWTSKNLAGAAPSSRIDIQLKVGAASVRIERY